MIDKTHVVGHCGFAFGGSGGTGVAGLYIGDKRFGYVDDKGKTAKSFIDCNSGMAAQITVEITLKNGSKTKAVIDL